METAIKFSAFLLRSVVLSCLCTILTKGLTNAQTLSTIAVDVSGTEPENSTLVGNLAQSVNATNYDANDTLTSLNLNTTQENSTERLEILVFDAKSESEYSRNPNNGDSNSTKLNDTELLFNRNESSLGIYNQTEGPVTSTGYNDFMNDSTLIVDVPGRTSDPNTAERNQNLSTSNTFIRDSTNETEGKESANLSTDLATEVYFLTNTTNGYAVQNLTGTSYKPVNEGNLDLKKNATNVRNGSRSSTEPANDSTIHLMNTYSTEMATPSTQYEKVTPKKEPVTTLRNGAFGTDQYTVANGTETTPSMTMLFIPYAYGNETKTTKKAPTTTTKVPSATARGRSGTGTTTVKGIESTDIDKQLVEKDKLKPKKKTYEELLPEEKENLVTVVFNRIIGNWTNLEESFSHFVSAIMNNYLKIWSTVKEPENELGPGLERAEVTVKNIHYLKPTPYVSKNLKVAMVTFYVTSSSPTGASSVFPAEIIVNNLKEKQKQLQKELGLNATGIFIGVHPSYDDMQSTEEKQFLSHYEPLFITLIAVAGTCLFILSIAIIFFKCWQNKGVRYNTDREKLNKEPHFCVRGNDLNPEHEILRDERQLAAEKDGGISNGDKKHLVRQNGDDGWMVPLGDMPFEDQNAPAIQDTRL